MATRPTAPELCRNHVGHQAPRLHLRFLFFDLIQELIIIHVYGRTVREWYPDVLPIVTPLGFDSERLRCWFVEVNDTNITFLPRFKTLQH